MGENRQGPFQRRSIVGDPRLKGDPSGAFTSSAKPPKKRKRVGPKTSPKPRRKGIQVKPLGAPKRGPVAGRRVTTKRLKVFKPFTVGDR